MSNEQETDRCPTCGGPLKVIDDKSRLGWGDTLNVPAHVLLECERDGYWSKDERGDIRKIGEVSLASRPLESH